MLLVTRTTESAYAANVVMRAAFIPCIGAGYEATSGALASALEKQSLKSVRSLRRDDVADETAWCVGSGWWLSTVDVAHCSPMTASLSLATRTRRRWLCAPSARR